ncbi:MAG: carbonic anhydrase/acetyltransferase-like protein (isoleucine patch superfamily) [Bacteroidia bacterium]|jgi:carbonic anhydrase/acetyltransferase-like protein (isoleucine patch superfamily)
MALIKSVNGKTPEIPSSCYLAENATVVGDVKMGEECSIWFNAVVRGDVNAIVMGDRVNVQDGAIVHCTYQKASTSIGNDVSIGHNAIIHGCDLKDNVLIGMGAIVMDNAVIESNVIIAAGAVVLENTLTESGWIYAGVPAKKVKQLTKENAEKMIGSTASNYVKYIDWFK